MTQSKKRLLVAIILVIEVPLAVLAWRDLGRRPAEGVRGKKSLWRAFILMNPGNSGFYWLGGRRGHLVDLRKATGRH
jgi:hypothetical protein